VDRHQIVTALAAMTSDEYDSVITEARGDGIAAADPQERAAAAVRRAVSGRQPGRPKATPESAAAALARYRAQ
jgi:hypothetical protein